MIQNVGNSLDDLKDISIEVDGDLSKLQRLLDEFRALPDDGADSILVRMLQHSYPRIAGALVVLGIIEHEFQNGALLRHRIAWDRVNRLLTSPQTLLIEALDRRVTGDAADVANLHLLTVHLAALMLAPRVLLHLEHHRLGVDGLPAGPDDPPFGFLDNNPFLRGSRVSCSVNEPAGIACQVDERLFADSADQ